MRTQGHLVELTQSKLEAALASRQVRFFDSVESTNDVALLWLSDGAPSGSIVIADEQTHGRGRLGRKWSTPPGAALAISVILRPKAEQLHQLTMLGALVICGMLEDLGITSAGIKWPNDVIIAGRKVAGILPEAVWQGNSLEGAVLGIGVNVRVNFAGTPLLSTAVSLESALGKAVDRLDLITRLMERIESWFAYLGTPELFQSWRSHLLGLGMPVSLQTAEGILSGTALDVTPEGALIVQDTAGHERILTVGDIVMA